MPTLYFFGWCCIEGGSGREGDSVRINLVYRNKPSIGALVTDRQGTIKLRIKKGGCVEERTSIYVPRSELGSKHGIVREITPFLDSLVPERWHESFIEGLTSLACPRDGDLTSVASQYHVLVMSMSTLVESEGAEGAIEQMAAELDADPSTTVFRPATWSLLRSLETVPEDKLDVEDCCAICTDNYGVSKGVGSSSSEVVLLPCKHTYHRSCIAKWLRRDHVCPLCRLEMPHEVVVSSSSTDEMVYLSLLGDVCY